MAAGTEEPGDGGSARRGTVKSRDSMVSEAESPPREPGSRAGHTSPSAATAGTEEAPRKRRKVNHGGIHNCSREISGLTPKFVQHVFIVGVR